MTNGEVTDLMYSLFIMVAKVGGPILIISMVVGIVISILQAATQIHEQTLTFVPKLIVIGLIMIILGGSMLENLQDFMTRIFTMMAG